eukprot:Selendium_serpulae@DN4415_c0_g2_i1.p3
MVDRLAVKGGAAGGAAGRCARHGPAVQVVLHDAIDDDLTCWQGYVEATADRCSFVGAELPRLMPRRRGAARRAVLRVATLDGDVELDPRVPLGVLSDIHRGALSCAWEPWHLVVTKADASRRGADPFWQQWAHGTPSGGEDESAAADWQRCGAW